MKNDTANMFERLTSELEDIENRIDAYKSEFDALHVGKQKSERLIEWKRFLKDPLLLALMKRQKRLTAILFAREVRSA